LAITFSWLSVDDWGGFEGVSECPIFVIFLIARSQIKHKFMTLPNHQNPKEENPTPPKKKLLKHETKFFILYLHNFLIHLENGKKKS
jgi:hypothetical protein